MTHVKFYEFYNLNGNLEEKILPNICPYCNHGMLPCVVSKYTNEKDDLFLTLECPVCGEVFIAMYHHHTLKPLISHPEPKVDNPFKNLFEDKFQNFQECYMQSLLAEEYSLDKISGMGYRRALEFLVKEYLIYYKNNNQEKILNLPLSQSINLIEDNKIQTLAKASAWLSNDHVHILNKHPDKTTEDIKALINALARFIESEIAYNDSLSIIKSNSSNGSE